MRKPADPSNVVPDEESTLELAEADAHRITETLDRIDGAFQRAELGRGEADAGAGISPHDLISHAVP